MKIFTIIGVVVVCLWAWHFFGHSAKKMATKAEPVVTSAANSAWQATAPYLNEYAQKLDK